MHRDWQKGIWRYIEFIIHNDILREHFGIVELRIKFRALKARLCVVKHQRIMNYEL